ncbi:pullulanase-type alpha-1,6-glucosidase [Actinomyces wuliandei]|uniref:pullulanase-type alpha-1,6-glucosidase n=1 Tax=Actinomyces wuliandei TaxID=2057743 RepID=UPI0013E36C51|nr:pullulanase-type alpha-1,6-glucosidase [Actinomyces wuliandei]
MTFTPTTTSTTTLLTPSQVSVTGPCDPPVAGSAELRAYWVEPDTLAWPVSLLPRGTGREDVVDDEGAPRQGAGLSLSLVLASRGGARVVSSAVRGTDGLPDPMVLPLRVAGDLPRRVLENHPNLEGYVALSLVDDEGAAGLDEDGVREALTGQLLVVQRVRVPVGADSAVSTDDSADSGTDSVADAADAADTVGAAGTGSLGGSGDVPGPGNPGIGAADALVPGASGQDAVVPQAPVSGPQTSPAPGPGEGVVEGVVDAVTGVQTAVVLDHLYADAARRATLGVTFSQGCPSFALWAPTAKSVTLLSWPTGDPHGSVPRVAGPAVRTLAERGEDGCWRVPNRDATIPAGCQYLWEVEVYVPATGRVETNLVTDPYSVALTVDSTRSVAADLSDPRLAPRQWTDTPAPVVANDASRSIYELHVRDFSAADTTVPASRRGTYKAFTLPDSAGMRHLTRLARAGLSTVHLMPVFDIATIPERRTRQAVPDVPAEAGPASADQQAAITAVADTDAYNWGYDPFHWMVPEGSYATDGHQDGGARTVELREMVGALHAAGLQVVLDQVYNHTAASGQAPTSVLDKVVPGYYHRLDAVGKVTTSTCCANTATENAMTERLMIDSVLWWARHYKVDGFRFDLMGHHSRDTMVRLREALNRLTLADDDVDGRALYLYGEGWSFGEVASNALFTQASQGQLDGTGIGTFNDRLRDAVHGGSPFDVDHRARQGFGSGLVTDPNGHDHRSPAEQAADLAYRTDLVRLGLAGNLRTYGLTTAEGAVRRGEELGFNGSVAAYASAPQESVSYVEAHDNETLYDLLAYKLPRRTTMADRVRMHILCLATVTLGQSPAFWAAGTELLRSKSLDRDSYNSGDWFNAVDWTGRDNGFGRGLPPGERNRERWGVQSELLGEPSLVPSPAYIATARDQALDLLRLRASTPLFWLGDPDLVRERVSFPGSGPGALPGVVAMLVDDTDPHGSGGFQDIDPALDGVLVVLNASAARVAQPLPTLAGRDFRLSRIQEEGADGVVRTTRFDPVSGTVSVPARTVAVLTQAQERPESRER